MTSERALSGGMGDLPASRAFLASLLGLTFLMNTAGRGITETFAVFLLPVEAALGVGRAEIASTYSLYMLAYGLAAPFAGQIVDRWGARLTYALGLVSLAAGYGLASAATALPIYVIGVGGLGGIGAALLGMVSASALLSRWFVGRIGSVMSLPYAAVGAGMLILPPLTQYLLQFMDWRAAHQVLALAALALLPVLLIVPIARMSAGSPGWQALRTSSLGGSACAWPLSRAVRTDAFWGLFAAYFFTSVAAYSVLPHSVAFLIEADFDKQFAANIFGLTGALSAVGIVAVGWVSDRFGRLGTVTATYVSTFVGILALLAAGSWASPLAVYAFVVFFGLMQGVRGPIIVALVAKLYAGGSVGAIFGAMSMAMGLGAATGSLISGALHEWTGTYLASLIVGALGALAGLAVFWLVPSLRRERLAAP
jgi:MFS family permease